MIRALLLLLFLAVAGGHADAQGIGGNCTGIAGNNVSTCLVTPSGGTGTISLAQLAADLADIRSFPGIDCTGVANSTVGVQAAFTAQNGKGIWIPANCTVVFSTATVPATLTIYGSGPTSVLKQRAAANSNFLVTSSNRGDLYLQNLTIDSNYTNQTVNASNQWAGVQFINAGQIGDNANLVVDNVVFLNGTSFNIRVVTNDTNSTAISSRTRSPFCISRARIQSSYGPSLLLRRPPRTLTPKSPLSRFRVTMSFTKRGETRKWRAASRWL